jgi:hypothetical protein
MSDDKEHQAVTLTNMVPEGRDHTELKASGQQLAYVVLTQDEIAKGYVRPFRDSYVHQGIRPKHPLRDLTDDEKQRYAAFNYVKYEAYPPDAGSSLVGRFWTERELDSGCGVLTRMSFDIAATYARDPKFYGGTFCCGCGKHLPLAEFVWDGTDIVVGT